MTRITSDIIIAQATDKKTLCHSHTSGLYKRLQPSPVERNSQIYEREATSRIPELDGERLTSPKEVDPRQLQGRTSN